MDVTWQAQYKRHLQQRYLGSEVADFLGEVAFWSIKTSALLR